MDTTKSRHVPKQMKVSLIRMSIIIHFIRIDEREIHLSSKVSIFVCTSRTYLLTINMLIIIYLFNIGNNNN